MSVIRKSRNRLLLYLLEEIWAQSGDRAGGTAEGWGRQQRETYGGAERERALRYVERPFNQQHRGQKYLGSGKIQSRVV